MVKIITVTKENFAEEVLGAGLPILIDFWATWCGPCRMIAPVIDEIAADFDGKLKIGKINVDEEPELANAFSISSIPAVALLRDGAIEKMCVGYRTKEQLLTELGLNKA